ncbi:MAG: T9SS type A sorting domain-containing protein [Prolixibacteraceae bacterium]|nr:T9SS type A sorting domain-containing protein [Prolixibacteraceae bacterium]
MSNTPGGEITWGESNNLTRESVQGSNPCIFSKDSNGSGWISASFTSGCGTSFTLLQKDVWAGRPLQPYDIWFTPSTPCLDQTVIAQARANNTALSATTYEWRNISNFTYHSSDYKEVHFTTSDGPLPYGTYVYVKGTNSCGSSSEYSEYLWVDDCGGGVPAVASIVFTPNPTSGETVLSIESGSKEATLDETTEWDLEIYSETLVLKEKKTGLKGNKYTIQTSGWKEGLYIVRVKYGEEVLSGKLVVK